MSANYYQVTKYKLFGKKQTYFMQEKMNLEKIFSSKTSRSHGKARILE